jgi:GT2 family glycosyltransferase
MLTVRCIKSLTKQENFDDLRVIVVDDGSIDGTSKYINENFPKFKILKGDGNLFWGGAVNKGIKYALRTASAQDWILLVNNDVMLLPSTIKNLIKFSESKNRKVLAGSLILDFKNKKTVIKSGTIIKNWFFNVTHHPHLGKNFKKISTKEPIKVGEENSINVVFSSEGKSGIQEKTITIITNCEPATRILKIKTEIIVAETAK